MEIEVSSPVTMVESPWEAIKIRHYVECGQRREPSETKDANIHRTLIPVRFTDAIRDIHQFNTR
jgi:hypothetical protein